MNDDLNINSFDELKTAMNEALHNGGVSPEAADYLMERFEVLCADIDNVFLAISANDVKEYYPNLSLDEAREVRDKANENLWNLGGYDKLDATAWSQIKVEVERVRGFASGLSLRRVKSRRPCRSLWRAGRLPRRQRLARYGRHSKVDATSVP